MNGPEPMYLRPRWPAQIFYDEDGTVIEYGNRWPDDPPYDAHSLSSHEERFAPLHQVADALAEHLVSTFRVHARYGSGIATSLGPPPPDFVRVTQLAPAGLIGVPMTIVFTKFPGVIIYTKPSSWPDAYPACGCDACDDPIERVVELMEDRVLGLPATALGWESRTY